jgi:hypothetical protein
LKLVGIRPWLDADRIWPKWPGYGWIWMDPATDPPRIWTDLVIDLAGSNRI